MRVKLPSILSSSKRGSNNRKKKAAGDDSSSQPAINLDEEVTVTSSPPGSPEHEHSIETSLNSTHNRKVLSSAAAAWLEKREKEANAKDVPDLPTNNKEEHKDVPPTTTQTTENEACADVPSEEASTAQINMNNIDTATSPQIGVERTVIFVSEKLGIKLNRGADGLVRVVSVSSPSSSSSPTDTNNANGDQPTIIRNGTIELGDVVREVAGFDLRRPITDKMWSSTVALIRAAPRPLAMVVAPEQAEQTEPTTLPVAAVAKREEEGMITEPANNEGIEIEENYNDNNGMASNAVVSSPLDDSLSESSSIVDHDDTDTDADNHHQNEKEETNQNAVDDKDKPIGGDTEEEDTTLDITDDAGADDTPLTNMEIEVDLADAVATMEATTMELELEKREFVEREKRELVERERLQAEEESKAAAAAIAAAVESAECKRLKEEEEKKRAEQEQAEAERLEKERDEAEQRRMQEEKERAEQARADAKRFEEERALAERYAHERAAEEAALAKKEAARVEAELAAKAKQIEAERVRLETERIALESEKAAQAEAERQLKEKEAAVAAEEKAAERKRLEDARRMKQAAIVKQVPTASLPVTSADVSTADVVKTFSAEIQKGLSNPVDLDDSASDLSSIEDQDEVIKIASAKAEAARAAIRAAKLEEAMANAIGPDEKADKEEDDDGLDLNRINTTVYHRLLTNQQLLARDAGSRLSATSGTTEGYATDFTDYFNDNFNIFAKEDGKDKNNKNKEKDDDKPTTCEDFAQKFDVLAEVLVGQVCNASDEIELGVRADSSTITTSLRSIDA